MEKPTPIFKNKKERNDIFIALVVLLFFVWLGMFSGLIDRDIFNFRDTASIATDIDTDNDGINDNIDDCPTLYGYGSNGCPIDTDKDGVYDSEDACVYLKGNDINKGCPSNIDYNSLMDTDLDGVIDRKDKCPNKAGKGKYGCPLDTDADGVYDAIDECPNEKGLVKYDGCPESGDIDSDGVINSKDKCPRKPGTIKNEGCPKDTDGDGILDHEDRCPTIAAPENQDGCPLDTDGDGIYDRDDRCPNKVGSVENGGCPVVILSNEDSAVLTRALSEVQFETGSAQLKASSYTVLDQIAAIMNRNVNSILEIKGHTDNTASKKLNYNLSIARAEACKSYLIQKGILANRIRTQGLGENNPAATNETAQGRALNRRVEFILK